MNRRAPRSLHLLSQPTFVAVSLCHFAVDVLNGQTGILLAVLSLPLGLTNTAIGLIATLYTTLGSLSQPAFGWLTDRYGERWAIAGGVLWMAAFFALVAVLPGYWPIACLLCAALGSAAFHPPGAMKAAQLGHQHMAGQMATAASLFFLSGQGGLALGPAAGGLLLDRFGPPGLLLLCALAVPVGLYTLWQLRTRLSTLRPSDEAPATGPPTFTRRPALTAFMGVMLLAGLRTWAQTATVTFAPKYFHDAGLPAMIFGSIVALFMGGSALGGVAGAALSERWGQRRTITLALLAGAVPFFLLPAASGAWIFVLAALAGMLNGAPHSILVTAAQRSLPGRASLASGIILGFMFTAGALGTYVSGLAADQIGLAAALRANAALSLAGAVVSVTLALAHRRQRQASYSPGD